MKILDLQGFKAAWLADEVSSVSLVADGSSFEIRFVALDGAAVLADERGLIRRFDDPSEALLLLHSLGIVQSHVDTQGWSPDAKTAYDRWVTAKVQASVAGLEDGSNATYSQDEWSAIKAARKARRDVS